MGRGVMPTRAAIRTRRMNIEPECGLCGHGEETLEHIFLECPITLTCWTEAELEQEIQSVGLGHDSIADWVFQALQVLPKEAQLGIFSVMWSFWGERNRRVWDRESKTKALIVRAGKELISDWKMAHASRGSAVNAQRARRCDKWHLPQAGWLKINIDGALFAEERKHGIGAVVRDERGAFRGLMQICSDGTPPPNEVEANALLQTIKWAGEMRMQRVIYEMDSQIVAHAVNRDEVDRTEFGRIISKCREALQNQVNSKVRAVRRCSNGAAHVLARRSVYSTQSFIGEVPPVWLSELLSDFCDNIEH
ncbi:Putative ribonuclease H protein At1g65750 [Linum perenne]